MMTDRPVGTIMGVGAHHDDNELFAGTLKKHADAGWRVVSVVMTAGTWIGGKMSPAHTPIREGESLEAARLIGMECEFLRLPESDLQVSIEARDALVAVMRKHAPDLLITHPPHDYHWDHMKTAELVLQATYQSASTAVLPDVPGCSPPKLYYCDAWFVPFQPDHYVDVTDLIELKLDMLRCHKSQLPPEPQQGDMVDMARVQSRNRGIEAGVGYAEAFRFCPRLGSVRMTDLLI